MVLGEWNLKDTLYGEGFSVLSNGDLGEQLRSAIQRLPHYAPLPASPARSASRAAFTVTLPENGSRVAAVLHQCLRFFGVPTCMASVQTCPMPE
jgi:hypothetical protein